MKSRLQLAMNIIDQAHRDQTEKFYGTPYVEHCYRVMHRMTYKCDVTEGELLAALCHDVLEDVNENKRESYREDIRYLLGAEVLRLVEILRRDASETYRQYIERVKEDARASLIKECDLDDHLDESRVDREGTCYIMLDQNQSLRKRYEIARAVITSVW